MANILQKIYHKMKPCGQKNVPPILPVYHICGKNSNYVALVSDISIAIDTRS